MSKHDACPDCGKPKHKDSFRCEDCYHWMLSYNSLQRQKRKQACPDCLEHAAAVQRIVDGDRAKDEKHCACCVELRVEIARLKAEAYEDIEAWAAYASDYFKDKHDLAGTLAKWKPKGGTDETV